MKIDNNLVNRTPWVKCLPTTCIWWQQEMFWCKKARVGTAQSV